MITLELPDDDAMILLELFDELTCKDRPLLSPERLILTLNLASEIQDLLYENGIDVG